MKGRALLGRLGWDSLPPRTRTPLKSGAYWDAITAEKAAECWLSWDVMSTGEHGWEVSVLLDHVLAVSWAHGRVVLPPRRCRGLSLMQGAASRELGQHAGTWHALALPVFPAANEVCSWRNPRTVPFHQERWQKRHSSKSLHLFSGVSNLAIILLSIQVQSKTIQTF